MSTKCYGCEHRHDQHKDGCGICLAEGCQCNLFRETPPKTTCQDCPIGGREGDGPVCPNVEQCDRECEQSVVDTMDDMRRDFDARLTITRAHVPPEFIDAMNAIFEAGVKGDRVALGWQNLSPTGASNKLKNLLIHLANDEYDAAACNALILWWHFQRKADDATT